jgi:hypothetical protein
MDLRRLKKPAIAVVTVFFGAVVTAWVRAKMEGTPLKGVPGIIRFWVGVFQGPVPVWSALIAVVVVALGLLLSFAAYKKRASGRVDLRIVVLSTPPPQWHIGAMREVPLMSISFRAQMAHLAGHSLQIVKGYLEGTECVGPFTPLVVAGPHDPPQTVHFGVRPILARDGESVAGHVILVDQFGNKHRTERIRFAPASYSAAAFNSVGNEIHCCFCKKTISLEELHESSAVPAHKACIR